MATAPDKTKVEAYPADRDRLNTLAAQLTQDGPGRFGQAETIRWLLDGREDLAGEVADLRERLFARDGVS